MRFAQGWQEVSMRLHEVGMRFARGWHEIGMRWHKVGMRSVKGWHEVCTRLSQGWHKVAQGHMRFAQGSKIFQSLHIMYDWSQVKIILVQANLRRIFKN